MSKFDLSKMFPEPGYKDIIIVKVDGIKRKVDWVALELHCVSIVEDFIFKYDMDEMTYKYSSFDEEEWTTVSEKEAGRLYKIFLKKWQEWVKSK